MEKKILTSKEYVQIRELVASSSQKCLQSLLGFTPRKSHFDDTEYGAMPLEIYPSTPKASALLECLHCKLSEKNGGRYEIRDKDSILTVDDVLQALLMVDPSCITPWSALAEFSSALHNNSVSLISMLQCVSSIEEFLLKAKFSLAPSGSNLNEKLVPQCIRELMVQFVEKLTNHLHSTIHIPVNNNPKQLNRTHCEVIAPTLAKLELELLRTVFTVCRGWSSDLFNDFVLLVHFRRPSTQRVKIWLQLVQIALPLLTNIQIERIGTTLLDVLCESPIKILPGQDMPSIISTVVEIASTLNSSSIIDRGFSINRLKLWRRIAFVALYQAVAHHDQQCYLQSEYSLKECVKKRSVGFMKIWISEIMDTSTLSTITTHENTIPGWFVFYLLLLCTEVLRAEERSLRPGRDDSGIGHKIGDSKDYVCFMSGQEYQSILNFAVKSKRDSIVNVDIDKIFYRNSGLFYLQDDGEKQFDWLSSCGGLIMRSLYLNNCNVSHEFMEINQSSVLPRATRLVRMVDHILMNCLEENLLQASIFAIVAKTVAYFEVPEFRIILEGKIEQDISKSSRLQNSTFSTLRLIVGSALKIDNSEKMVGRWIEIIDRSLPFSHVTYHNRILTTLSPARSSILNISQKLLAPLYSSWGGYEYAIGSSEQPFEPEIQQRLNGGIRGLLELIRSDRWGESEILAWATLSDTIVKDLPPLPLRSRRWLFQTLGTCVTNGIFGAMTVDRLLRASVIRMSSFFVDYEIESKILFSTQQMEEVGFLHRFIAILVRYLVTVNGYSESRHILLAQGREAFLRSALLYKKGQLVRNQVHHGISKQHDPIQDNELDSFIFCWLVFLKINFYLLDNAMPESSKFKTHGHLESSSTKHEASLQELICRIKEIENQDLQVKHCADPNYEITIPSPQHTVTMDDFDSIELINMEPTKKFIYFDLLLEFLFLVPLPPRESYDFNDPLSWKVIIATGFLINRKHRSSKNTECFLSMETIKKTAEPFLSISSLLVRSAIHLDCGLSALEELLAPIVTYCRALHLTLEAIQAPDCARIIVNIWNLYQAVASEKACVKMIKYLESHIPENHGVSTQRDHHLFSLKSIYTESDVDEVVQQLRFSCLRPFLSCMTFLSNKEEIDTNLSQSLVSGMLGALVTDLRAGLDGRSGGIPRQLYIIFCMSIEECGSILFYRRQSSFDYSIFLLFKEVTAALSNILVMVPLRDAVLFRTTFILAVAVFPSMCRDLMRSSICNSGSKSQTAEKMLRADSVLFDEVLEDCIEILSRWAALREPYLIPWLEIAGPDHSDIKYDTTLSEINYYETPNSIAFDCKQESEREIPRFVHVPSPTRNRRKTDSQPEKIPQRIRLYTKELWSWALSCSLLGLEQKWLESKRTIQTSDSIENYDRFQVSSIGWREFFGARKMELQSSLLHINRFFSTSQGLQQRDQMGNQVMLDMMAMNLPSAPRLRLCCLIECVSRVLIHSIRRSCWFLCGVAKSSARDISVFESICCLSAWLSLEEDPEKDFSVGLFKWLAIASRKRPPSEISSSRKCDKAELFGKLSLVSEQVHELYLALKDLQKTLLNCGDRTEDHFQSELIRYFFEGKDTMNEILSHTALKLHSLQQAIPRGFQMKSFPDFPYIREAGSDLESLERKRVRSRKRQTIPKSKKKKIQTKNRNKVVDIFMNLDKGTNSPRRDATRDAYTDLEDFLVEG